VLSIRRLALENPYMVAHYWVCSLSDFPLLCRMDNYNFVNSSHLLQVFLTFTQMTSITTVTTVNPVPWRCSIVLNLLFKSCWNAGVAFSQFFDSLIFMITMRCFFFMISYSSWVLISTSSRFYQRKYLLDDPFLMSHCLHKFEAILQSALDGCIEHAVPCVFYHQMICRHTTHVQNAGSVD